MESHLLDVASPKYTIFTSNVQVWLALIPATLDRTKPSGCETLCKKNESKNESGSQQAIKVPRILSITCRYTSFKHNIYREASSYDYMNPSQFKVLKNLFATAILCRKNPLAALLAPRQILFGSMTVLVSYYVTGTIVRTKVGLDQALT